MARRGRRGTDRSARRLHGERSVSRCLGQPSRAFSSISRGYSATGPWLIALALLLGAVGVGDREARSVAAPFFAHHNLCSKSIPMTGHALAKARCVRSCCWSPDTRSARCSGSSAVWRSDGRAPSAIGCIRCCASSGRLPATAWLPLAFFVFPSSWSASVFLIALATGFPVAVLTWSGVASVNAAYYDVARTLGARPSS